MNFGELRIKWNSFQDFGVILKKIWIFEDGVTAVPEISGQIWGFGQNGEKRYW